MAGIFFNEVAELVIGARVFVYRGDFLDAFTYLQDWAAHVVLAKIHVQRSGCDKADNVRRIAILEEARNKIREAMQ